MKNLLNFKRFIEDMDASPEKTRTIAMGGGEHDNTGTSDYLSQLGDEEGMEWQDLTSALEAEPWVSAHFGIGSGNNQILHKLSAWQIVKGSLTPNGADIRLKPQKGDRSYLKGNRLNKSKYEDNKRYHLSRKELIKFLTTGWSPAVQAAQGGGDPSMGGMPDPSMGASPMAGAPSPMGI